MAVAGKKKKSSLDRVIKSFANVQTQKRTIRPLLDWIAHYNIHLRPGVPFSLKGHEYLREIYNHGKPDEDRAEDLSFEKGAQVGISTVCVMDCLCNADQLKIKIGYYFHTDDAVRDFGDDRLDPLINNNDYLRGRVQESKEEGGVYNKGLKQIGHSTAYFRGMEKLGKVKTIDLDLEYLDELDEANQKHVQFAKDRLMHSPLQWKVELSQPSLPDFGIDKSFADSDQRFWLLKCPSCGEYNCLEENFPRNFYRAKDREGYYRGCLKCASPLDMSAGEWVAKYPGRKKRGYHLSQLYTSIVPAGHVDPSDKIMAEYFAARLSSEKERFTISRLGFPYGGTRQPVTDEVLDRCEAQYVMGPQAGPATGLGIDVGDMKHLVVRGKNPVNGKPRILWVESFEDWERAGKIIEMFFRPFFIVDAMPYKDSAKELVRSFPGRGMIQYFKSVERRSAEGLDEKEVPVMQVDRTESLDNTTGEFKDGLIEIPSLALANPEQRKELEDFRAHLKALIADEETDRNGNKRRIYKSNTNHYGMAANSARIAEEQSSYAIWGAAAFQGGNQRISSGELSKVFG